MCFSAEANFAASAVIGAVGVATLSHVRQPRAVLFAATPLLFAAHQFVEGFVWLGLDGHLRPEATDHLVFLFILYAQAVLPLLMPAAVLLMEPPGRRRAIVAGLALLGLGLSAYVFYGLIAYPSTARIDHHSLAYANPVTQQTWIAAAYVAATCGALVASSHRVVAWFGWLNVAGVVATLAVRGYAFTSIWCLYAALVSVVLYAQFRGRRINVAAPNAPLAAA